MLDRDLIAKIEAKYGRPVRYDTDYRALAAEISQMTGCPISKSTIRRLWTSDRKQRLYTLDIIARYLGYRYWEDIVPNRLQ